MKKIRIFLLLLGATLTIAKAQVSSTTKIKQNNTSTWESDDDKEKLKLVIKGDVQISDDDKGISSLSDDGSITFQRKGDKLEIKNNKNGTLQYRINGDSKNTLSGEDQALLDDCIHAMIIRGINAEERTKRIYKQNGTNGVLQELPTLKGDYARQRYLSALLNFEMDSKEMTAILNNIDRYMHSDYYKAELLENVMGAFLNEESTSTAYLQTVQHIQSDYYQYTTMQKLLERPLTTSQSEQIMAIVQQMGSNYYQSEILQQILKDVPFKEDKFMETLQLVFAMKSDYYKSEIVKKLLDRNLKESEWSQLIGYTSQVNSDYYQSKILSDILKKMPQNDILKKNITEAAKSIKSEYYYGKVMRKIADS